MQYINTYICIYIYKSALHICVCDWDTTRRHAKKQCLR